MFTTWPFQFVDLYFVGAALRGSSLSWVASSTRRLPIQPSADADAAFWKEPRSVVRVAGTGQLSPCDSWGSLSVTLYSPPVNLPRRWK